MEKERAVELLNNIINQLSVSEKNDTIIKYLIHVGFEKDELVNVFGYDADEVDEAQKEYDEWGWSGGPIFA